MKKLLLTALSALAIGLLPAGAQWGPREIPEPTDGLKDAYKDYFKIGVAVNNHNVVNPGEVAVVLREFNSITAENAMKPEPTEPQKGVFRWEDEDKDGNLLSKEEFYANMKHHIQAVVNRYKDIVPTQESHLRHKRPTPAP